MPDINSVSDLDQFLSKPLQKKQPKQQALAAPPVEPKKQSLPQIRSVQDLDSFLKQPIQKFDTAPVEKWRKAQAENGPSITRGKQPDLFSRLGDVPLGPSFTLRDAYRRFQTSIGHEDVTDPRVKWERDHVKKPLDTVAFLESTWLGVPGAILAGATGHHPIEAAKQIGAGLVGTVGDTINSLSSPENLAMLLGIGLLAPLEGARMLVDAGFSAQMAQAAVQGYKAGKQALDDGDGEAAVRYWTGGAVSLLFAFLSGKGAVETGAGIHADIATRNRQLGKLDELAQSKYKKPWDQLDKYQKADITYGLATTDNAPISAATAQKHGVTLRGDEARPGFDRAAELVSQPTVRSVIEPPLRRVEMAPPPEPEVFAPEKRPSVEGPTHYYLPDVRTLSAEEREAKRYSLEDARKQLDEERRIHEQEQKTLEQEEAERQRIAKEQRETAEGQARYQRERTGQEPVVRERRALRFDTETADKNQQEYNRLTTQMDQIAEEKQYVDVDDMLRSIGTEKTRGQKLAPWKQEILNVEARRREVLRLADPRALEPKLTDTIAQAAKDMALAEREQNMRDAAAKLEAEAKKKTTPEEFEHVQAEADEAKNRAEEIRTEREQKAAAAAAQSGERQIFPVGAPIDMKMGKATEIVLPNGKRLPAHYALVYGDQLIPSHNPLTFEWNDDFQPREMQPRDYSTNKEAQAGAISGGQKPELDRVFNDDPTPHGGPPIILRDGRIPGGNGRFLRLQRAYLTGGGDAVFRALRAKAGQFEIGDIFDAERKPMLARVLDDDVERAEDLIAMGRDLNRTETMGFDVAEQAVIAGRSMPADMLEWGAAQMDALGDDASLRDFMRARGAQIVEKMMASGMIEPTKRAAYITRDGEMTEAAKDLFEAAWLGKIVDDPELLKTVPMEILRKLTRGVIGLAKAKVAGPMWDLSPEVKSALRLWKRINSVRDDLLKFGKKDDSLVGRYLHPDQYDNGSMLMDYGEGTAREQPHPTVEAIAKLLENSQKDVRDGFSDYGNDAEGKQGGLPGMEREEPVEVFNATIGELVDVKVKPEEWGREKAAEILPKPQATPIVPAAAAELMPAVPPPIETKETLTPPPEAPVEAPSAVQGTNLERLREFMASHPGYGKLTEPILLTADILTRNATGMPLDEFLQKHVAGVTQERAGEGALSQNAEAVKVWLGKSKKISVKPYGEQLALIGEPEKTYLIVNEKGQSAMVLESELAALEKVSRPLAQAMSFLRYEGKPVDLETGGGMTAPPEPTGKQGGLFDEQFEEGTLFADLDKGPKTLFQSPDKLTKGATEFLDDGKAIIHLYGNADASTFLHEFFHTMRRYLKPEDQKVLEDWLKIQEGRWSRDAEEKAARAFEYYHRQREVKTLPGAVREVFQKVQDLMRQIYASLKGSPLVKPSKEVSQLFDRWYGLEAPPEGGGATVEDVSPIKDKSLADIESKVEGRKKEVEKKYPVGSPGLTPEPFAPPPEIPKKHKFGNTQTDIPESSEAAQALNATRALISDSDLAGQGKEIDGNHVTVRYGIDGDDTTGIKKFLSKQTPFEVSLGKTDKFPPSESSDGAAVIIAPVDGPDLHRLNDELEKHGEFTEPTFDYKPHATVAYVKPEAADRYVGMDATDGKKFIVDKVTISNRDGSQEVVELKGGEKPAAKSENIPPAVDLEEPPLSAADREGQELVADGGRKLMDTGIMRVKVFPGFDEAAAWVDKNKKKIKTVQVYRLKDGRHVADFVPTSEKLLFQETVQAARKREMDGIERRLMSIIPEAERSRLAARLYDLKHRMTEPPLAVTPTPGKVLTLWTPEGEVGVEEVQRARTEPVRAVSHGLAPIPEPAGTGGVPERPEPSRLPDAERSAERPVRPTGKRTESRTDGGEPRPALPVVEKIRVAEPRRPTGPPIYSDADWAEKVKLYKLPDNAPTPTVAIPNELARMLMGGQRYIVEGVLSGLERHDAYILATTTGSGKTFMGSAVMREMLDNNPDAKILILTPSRTLIDGEGGWKQVGGDFGVEVQDLDNEHMPPSEPGAYTATWAGALNREGIEKFPWDLVIADEVQEARKWWSSQRGDMMKQIGGSSKKLIYMSATPFHTALEIGHMDKLGLWGGEPFEQWAKQFGVYRDEDGNLAGGRAPLKLAKLRSQLIERGQMANLDRNMEGYSAHFGVVPMDGTTAQGLSDISKAMRIAENYFQAAGKMGKIRPTRAQAITLAKRWLEYQRLPQAIELGKKLEREGWKVIFFSENKKEFNELFEFLKEADEGTGGAISQLLPQFRSTTDVLQEAFGDDIAIFAGKQSGARDAEKDAFNSGDKKHLYATYGAGGVGVSLHDKTGTNPRAVIYLGPPWSGVSFDQALGRPWRYGTKSDVRAYFLFSNARSEMDLVANKVAPRMESLRAMVSGVKFLDPVVKALRDVPENKEAALDYDFGNEHTAGMDDFIQTGDTKMVTSYAEMPIVSAKDAYNKGMKIPGGDGATPPGVVRLFQDPVEDEVLPDDLEAPALKKARSVNIDIAEEFIKSGAAPGNRGGRSLSNIQRRAVADAVMAQADGAARENPAAATQQVYTAWENAMTQIDAILSADKGGDDGLTPPPVVGGLALPPSPPPQEIGTAQALNWYFLTNGRDVIRNATRMAGVPRIGEKLARDIASYHVESGNIAGPWTRKYWDILKDNKITADEHRVLALTLANREMHKPWIDRELARLRAATPMNERIAKAVEDVDKLRRDVFKRLQKDDIYLTVWDAASGAARRVNYAEMEEGQGYWPRRYDYDAKQTVVDPETGKEVTFTLRELTEHEAPGEAKREAIIKGMMDRHGLSRAEVEDWMSERHRKVPLVGHVERAREADLPFFRTDPDVMISYLEGAGETLARKKFFAQDGSKVAGAIAQIPDQKARAITKGIMDSLLNRNPMENESRFMLRFAADWSVLSKMTFSAIKVLGHPAHGALMTNMRSFFGAMFEGTFDLREARRLADMAGSTLEQTKVEMLSEYGVDKKGIASKFLKYNLWQTGYKWGRVVADANARIYMERYALPELLRHPKNDQVRRQLHDFLLLDNNRIDAAIERGRWTDEDRHWAAKAFADKVMFTFDPTELPPAWRARAGAEKPVEDAGLAVLRLTTLLKGYQFKTSALLKDALYDEIRQHGNFKPLLPFVLMYPILGQLITMMTALATGNAKYFKRLLDDNNWTPGQDLKRYLEDIAHQIGDSQLVAALEAFSRGQAQLGSTILAEYAVGPTASDVFRTTVTAPQIAFAKTQRQRKRIAARYIKDTLPVLQPPMNLIDLTNPGPNAGHGMIPPPLQ